MAQLGSRLVFVARLWSVHHWDICLYVGEVCGVTMVSTSQERWAMCMGSLSWLHMANETVENFKSIWDNYWDKRYYQ